MMPVPTELKWLTFAVIAIALWLTWSVRKDRAPLGSDRWAQAFEDFINLFLMLMMLATSVLQVAGRHVLGEEMSMPWTEEAGRLVMVWAALWGAAALQRTDDHIHLAAVFDLFPAGAKRPVLIFGDLVVIALLVPLTWWGWQNARGLDIMTSISLGLPLSIFTYSVPVTSALMLVYTLRNLRRRLTNQPVGSGGVTAEI